MPINRLLKDKRTPEEIEFLNKAFNHALDLLGVVDRNDPLCDMIARKVRSARQGISEPREIAEMAVAPDWPTVRSPQLAASSFRMSPVGTKRTSGTGLTMSVLEGKADLPVARPDFSV
jgi:hypothetical protein